MKETPSPITFRHRMEYLLARGFELFFKAMPLSMAEVLGRAMGSLVWLIFPYRLEVVFTNLSCMFPDLDQRDKNRLAHRIYRHHGYVLATYPLLGEEKLRERIHNTSVTRRGKTGFEECLARGRGAILTGIHFGHWEAYSAWLCMMDYPLSAIYRTQKNPLMDRYFMQERLKFGGQIRYLTRSGVGRFVKELRQGRLLVVALDQRAGKKGTPVRFMNRTVRVPKGAAFLHQRTGAPIVWAASTIRNGRFHVELGELEFPRHSVISEASVNDVTQRIMSHYESIIRKHPEQWFWFHKLLDKREYPRRIERSWRDVRDGLGLFFSTAKR